MRIYLFIYGGYSLQATAESSSWIERLSIDWSTLELATQGNSERCLDWLLQSSSYVSGSSCIRSAPKNVRMRVSIYELFLWSSH
jgi:hypothetical protein